MPVWTGDAPRCFRIGSALAALAVVLSVAASTRADDRGYELFIERSPAGAGEVSPNSGTHRFSPNSTVNLTADAQPGYRFAYWLGDVCDPHAERTTIVLTGPKVVVAVFHPEPGKRVEDQVGYGAGGGGAGDLVATCTDLSVPGWSPAGGGPGGGTERVAVLVPVVVTPEPTSIALLGLGVLALRRRRP